MGCASSDSHDQQSRLIDLENLLQAQEREKAELQAKVSKIKEQQENNANNGENDEKLTHEIERLSNEKKQVFKAMLKERKTVSSLEDEIQEYKTQISDMEQQINTPKPPKPEPIKPTKPKQQKQVGFGKSILDGISIPKPMANLPSNERRKRMKDNKSESDGSSSSEDETLIARQTTEKLDIAFDPAVEVTHVYAWIHDKLGQRIDSKNKQAVRTLKQRLARLLTSRSEGYRQTLMYAYRDEYGSNLEKEIKGVLQKGFTMDIIHGLFMTRAQFDAVLISQHVANWEIEPIADVICCRSLIQIQELYEAYKRKCKLDIKKQLQALAQKDKKNTLIKVIGGIFDLSRKESPNVDMKKVNEDLSFMMITKNFKGDSKEKLVLIFTTNSVQYINVLNDNFKLKSKDKLITFIDKKLGPKSTAGHFCKTRILYALDPPDYYAQKIKKLGVQYKKNKTKIANIFIQRMETDLDLIQKIWTMKKYGDGKELKEWIAQKSKGTNSGFFLQKMLENSGRYTAFNQQNNFDGNTQQSKIQKMMM